MMTLTEEGWSLPLGDFEQLSTWSAQAETQRPLSELERKRLATRAGGYWKVLALLSLAAAAVGSLVLPLGLGGGAAFVIACLVFMLALNFPIAENRKRYVRDDIELGTKQFASGRAATLRVAGAHCILGFVADGASARTIEFKLPRQVFESIQQGQPIEVWYVPVSETVMELSAGSYRYRLGDAGKQESLRI
jgi:hypothetical protein